MKITVVTKKKPVRKPTNYCPWVIDDIGNGPNPR